MDPLLVTVPLLSGWWLGPHVGDLVTWPQQCCLGQWAPQLLNRPFHPARAIGVGA